jgi:hypothetical protein
VFSLCVVLGELCGHGFWPRRPFPGRLSLDGAAVTTDATIDGINAAKAGARLIPSGGDCCWEIDHGRVVIGVSTARDGRFVAGGAVAEVAISARRAGEDEVAELLAAAQTCLPLQASHSAPEPAEPGLHRVAVKCVVDKPSRWPRGW